MGNPVCSVGTGAAGQQKTAEMAQTPYFKLAARVWAAKLAFTADGRPSGEEVLDQACQLRWLVVVQHVAGVFDEGLA
jgi:hypothetical protein